MKHILLIAVGGALIALMGCASPSRNGGVAGAAPGQHGTVASKSTLQANSSRAKAPVDLNEDEFMQNNNLAGGE